MKKFKHLYIEIYNINLYYMRCDRCDYEKQIDREFDKQAPLKCQKTKGTFEVYEKEGTDIGVIWLSPTCGISELVHECFHFVHYFMQLRGLYLNDASDEAYAYLLMHVVDRLKRILN